MWDPSSYGEATESALAPGTRVMSERGGERQGTEEKRGRERASTKGDSSL